MSNLYLWIKVLHILAIISWMAGMDCVVDEVGPNSAVVQESVAFARSPVPRNGFSLALCLDQKFEQLALCLLHLLRKRRIPLHAIEAGPLLARPQFLHSRPHRVGIRMTAIYAQ